VLLASAAASDIAGVMLPVTEDDASGQRQVEPTSASLACAGGAAVGRGGHKRGIGAESSRAAERRPGKQGIRKATWRHGAVAVAGRL
jgi:hypothetical protein